MARHLGKTFTGQQVVLDGEMFERCTFTRCRLVYRGTGPAAIEGCTFDRCAYELHGPAANTLHFLRALHATGPQGRQLVGEVFDSIRQEPPPAAGAGAPGGGAAEGGAREDDANRLEQECSPRKHGVHGEEETEADPGLSP